MASSKEDSTTAAAKQLGSMSLNRSAERNDENTKPIAKSGTPAKLCSACGENSVGLMKCGNCKCVWYCGKDCQNKHWKEHKKECKPIKKELDERGGKLDVGNELDLGPLPDLPPREECPICMHVLPLHAKLTGYAGCCGKIVCCACEFQHQIRSEQQATERGQNLVSVTCVFCREPIPESDEEILTRLRKRIKRKDANALRNVALHYGYGYRGLSVDQAKCLELLHQSADLGFPLAQSLLGDFHHQGMMGLEQNEDEGLKYWERAAEGGHINAQHNIGCAKATNNDLFAAMHHWRLSASAGYRASMGTLIVYFEDGVLHHGDLAETLQAFYCARSEMKSKDRDAYIGYLKRTGKYREEYNF